MKEYKFLDDVYYSNVESELNSLAKQGWVVKSFNITYEGEENSNQKISVLLEYDDFDYQDTLTGIYERLGNISDKTSRGNSNGTDLSRVHDKLAEILEQLEYIGNNSSN